MDLARDSFLCKSSSNWVEEPSNFIICKLLNDVIVLWKKQQVSDALFSLPGYLRGLEGFYWGGLLA
jgi:hypothetical protein